MGLTTSTSGAAIKSEKRMVVRMLNLRWIGGKTQIEKIIMTGPEVMRGTASRFAGSNRPPSLIGAEAYRGSSSSRRL